MSNCNMHRCGVADFNLSFFLGFRRPWEPFERLIEKPTRNTDRKYPLSRKIERSDRLRFMKRFVTFKGPR
jgi:hypothetical protein